MPRWNDGRRLTGRVAVVTGANGGLGSVAAAALGREGASVALGARTGREQADAVAARIVEDGGRAHVGFLDVLDRGSIDAFVADTVARYGDIDLLVNAAGRIDPADAVRFDAIDAQAWDAIFAIDVRGSLLMCLAVVPSMRRRGAGSIVNFSGSYGNGTNQDNMVNSVAIAFCAAKGAVRAMTAAMARDLAPHIRVNAISPGPIAANWEADWGIPREHMEEAIAMTPLKRLGDPMEIGETVVFLASDGAGYMTGQNLLVDAGWTLAG